MQVLKIGDSLEAKYRGAGHALAAVTGGQVVDLRYLREVLPDYEEGEGFARLTIALDDDRLGPVVRELQALGEVSVGMVSCWEFVEL